MPKKKRCRRLTAAERKAVYAPPTENAGVGWATTRKEEPRKYAPNRERDTTPALVPDKDLKR